MSSISSPNREETADTATELTDDERAAFEYLFENAENYENPEFVRGLAELVLQEESASEVSSP